MDFFKAVAVRLLKKSVYAQKYVLRESYWLWIAEPPLYKLCLLVHKMFVGQG